MEADIHTSSEIYGSVVYETLPVFNQTIIPTKKASLTLSHSDRHYLTASDQLHPAPFCVIMNTSLKNFGQPHHHDRHKNHQSAGLMVAAHAGNFQEANRAISLGADLDFDFPWTPDMKESPDIEGSTPLMMAAAGDHVRIVKLLLDKGANADKVRKDGVSALHVAAQQGSLGAARLLLDAGADVNCAHGECQTTPLFIAVCHGRGGLVKLLLERGADVHLGPLDGKPMDAAAKSGHAGITGMLVAAGATPPTVEADDERNSVARFAQRFYASMCMGCYRRSGSESGVKLKQCSLCLEVSYCSRECQKKDWRDGHKEDCAGRRKIGNGSGGQAART